MNSRPPSIASSFRLCALALGLAAAASGQVSTNPFTITTFAGLAQNPGTNSGMGTAARFTSPYGVAIDGSGNIFVADLYETVRMITPSRVVTTVAGTPGTNGKADGTGAAATFNGASGIAVDGSGNLYIADTFNDTIREIAPGGIVTTYAGTAGTAGSTDGTGAARFNQPYGVAVDKAGNLYVADTGNNTIRKIAPGGVVSTFAGKAGVSGSADGTGAAASFLGPRGVAVDASGNVYVADTRNYTIRMITQAQVVTTLAGSPGNPGSADGTGKAALFGNAFTTGPFGVAVGASGNIYVSDTGNDTIRMIAPGGVVTTLAGTAGVYGSQDATGANASFSDPVGIAVDASGAVYVADFDNSTIRRGATAVAGYLIDLSVRASMGTGAQTPIIGFSIGGTGTTGTKPILVRGIGPTLASFGVTGVLADPQISLLSGSTVLQSNNDWGTPLAGNASAAALTATMAQVGAFALPAASKDAAIQATVNTPAPYTAQVSSFVSGGTGIVLAEVYDATPASSFSLTTPRLINISGRAQVGAGGAALIAGFVVGGAAPETLLIRGVGPTLGSFGVSGALADPVVTLNSGNTVVQSNTGWGGTVALTAAFVQVGAFALPATSADSALLVTVQPGSYTAVVTSASGSTGVALVEIYEVR